LRTERVTMALVGNVGKAAPCIRPETPTGLIEVLNRIPAISDTRSGLSLKMYGSSRSGDILPATASMVRDCTSRLLFRSCFVVCFRNSTDSNQLLAQELAVIRAAIG
jgi:hypothetical protein